MDLIINIKQRNNFLRKFLQSAYNGTKFRVINCESNGILIMYENPALSTLSVKNKISEIKDMIYFSSMGIYNKNL